MQNKWLGLGPISPDHHLAGCFVKTNFTKATHAHFHPSSITLISLNSPTVASTKNTKLNRMTEYMTRVRNLFELDIYRPNSPMDFA